MELIIKDNDIDYTDSYKTVTDMIYKLTHIYCALVSNRDKWLSKRESQFFTALVLVYLYELSFDKEESDFIFDAVFGPISIKRRKDYISKISKKGWVRLDSEGNINLPKLFTEINLKKKDYSIKIDLEWGI